MYHVAVCHHEVIKRRYIHVCSGLHSGGLLECCIHFLYCSNTLKLTSIRNTVARITSGIPKYAHISISGFIRDSLWLIGSLLNNVLTSKHLTYAPLSRLVTYQRTFRMLVSSLSASDSLVPTVKSDDLDQMD